MKPSIHFFRPDGTKPEFYACGDCGLVFSSVEIADECCRPRACSTCGKPIQARGYCRPCSDTKMARRRESSFANARKLTENEWGGPVFDPFGDGESSFHHSLDEALEHYEQEDEKPPRWFWGASRINVAVSQADIETMLENCLSDHHEGAEFHHVDELLQFVKTWNDGQPEHSFHCDETVAIVPADGEAWSS